MVDFFKVIFKDENGEWDELIVNRFAIVEINEKEKSIRLNNGQYYVVADSTLEAIREHTIKNMLGWNCD